MNEVRLASTIIALIGVITWTRFFIRSKEERFLSIAPLTFVFHVLLFDIVMIYREELATSIKFLGDVTLINLWSSVIHIHGLIVITGLGLFLAWSNQLWKQLINTYFQSS